MYKILYVHGYTVYFMDFFLYYSNLHGGQIFFHRLFPDIRQSLLVSKGKVEICDPLSSCSMEGWGPALLLVSDASIDKARGKMATVHPEACILKLLQPAAFRWTLAA